MLSFNKLKFSLTAKIAVAIGGFSLPLVCAVVYFLLSGNNKDIKFAQQELDGVRIDRQAQYILNDVGDHARLSALTIQGEKNLSDDLASSQNDVDQEFSALQTLNEQLKNELELTPEGFAKHNRDSATFETLQTDWNAAKAAGTQVSVEDSNAKHQKVLDDMGTYIAEIGDASNLMLDPNIESYYTIDAAIGAMPTAQAHLDQVQMFGVNLAAKTHPSVADRQQAAILASITKETDTARITNDEQFILHGIADTSSDSPIHNVATMLSAYTASAATVTKGLQDYAALSDQDSASSRSLVDLVAKNSDDMDKLFRASATELESLLNERLSHLKASRNLAIMLSVGGLLIAGLFAGLFVRRGITERLNVVVKSLTECGERLAGSARSISESSQSLSSSASEQAASLEETSASLEEISSMTKRNAENARKAKDLSSQTRSAADTGAADMEDMNKAMNAIKVSSGEVAKIVKNIDEIAFQTNILALNAAVEAARAGEAGAGFAVVADEVRNLAQRSARAAKETAEKIEDAIAKSQQGVQVSAKVAESLGEIVTKARSVDELVAEIAAASQEQSQGISEINTAITQMDRVTQSNAATAEESAAASEELDSQAATQQTAIETLANLVSGDGSAAHAAVAQQPVAPALRAAAPKAAPQKHEIKSPRIGGGKNGNGQKELAHAEAGVLRDIPMPDGFTDF